MSSVLACLDASAYAHSVCDYAAWLADLTGGEIRLLHVEDNSGSKGHAPALQLGLERMDAHGVHVAKAELASGALIDRCVAAVDAAQLVVVGKRGADSRPASRALGRHVPALIAEIDRPILLASRTFLPVSRIVSLLDADLQHRRTIEFLCAHSRLAELQLDVVIAAPSGEDASAKADWVRARLAAYPAEVFEIQATGADRTAAKVMESRGADLIIVSRDVLAGPGASDLSVLEADSLWGWRTPVLIC
jgi:hypothetical protein